MLDDILRHQCQLDPHRPVLVGVSGGPDSLCLLHILHTAGYRTILAYFNHQLRPEAAGESEALARLAGSLGIAFESDSASVRLWAEEHGSSIEEAARDLRYSFLFAAARNHQAQAVAVGHTADDQVETVLMHFLRGAGLAGLKGMQVRGFLPTFDPAIPLIRPLLSLWRADTQSYCHQQKLVPHYDLTNTDQVYTRNRLRHTLIPELEEYNPRFKEALVRMASALQGDHAILQTSLVAAWEQTLPTTGAGWVAFDHAILAASDTGLVRNLLRRAAELLRPESRDIGFDALDRGAAFVHDPAGKRVDFINGLYLSARGGKLYLAAYEADLPTEGAVAVQGELTFQVGTTVPLGDGWLLTSHEVASGSVRWENNPDPWTAWLDAEKAGDTLLVRARRTGDIFNPLGMGGQTVRLREFFINLKIPARARQHWPLVCYGERIAWIPGVRISHFFRVTESTRRLLELSLKMIQAD